MRRSSKSRSGDLRILIYGHRKMKVRRKRSPRMIALRLMRVWGKVKKRLRDR
jgi:hypothetical protein